MSERKRQAESCLIVTCNCLAASVVHDAEFPRRLQVMAEVLPDCDQANPAMDGLIGAAQVLLASTGRKQSAAMSRLRIEVARYSARASAYRHDAWKKAGGQVT